MPKPDPDDIDNLFRHSAEVFAGRTMPDPREITAVAVPVLLAVAAVGVALIIGAGIVVQGHTLWGAIIGAVIGWWQ